MLLSPEQLPCCEERVPFHEIGTSSLEPRVRFRPSSVWDLVEALGRCVGKPRGIM